ncbi:MAG: group II intron reverse transcriptase/maturase [Clostridia bacterium]|nr:group II intron reverse transcriptase/maturase [Clostridia bacterium]
MTKKGKVFCKGETPTLTTEKKILKKQKLRNAEYYDFQKIQDDLYEQSIQGKIFQGLIEIIALEENIKLAYRNIKKNHGSHTAGVDNATIKDLAKWQDDRLIKHVRKKLQWYQPQAVRRVEIPKSSDPTKKRPLGIPTIMDRLIQQCILQVLEPICEAKFHDKSNGFRPNRSCETAIAQAEKNMQLSKLHYAIDIDIKGFFDNVNHGKLLKQMWTLGIRDKKLISIISAMLKAEVAGIGFPEKGTPQGGIISPLLSNIVLNELDWWISSQWETMPTHKEYAIYVDRRGAIGSGGKMRALKKSNLKECRLVRYADDFKIFCKTRKDAEKLFVATKSWLKERLGLDISPEKSKIVNLKKQYSEFLGFKLKVTEKGKHPNGEKRYVVKSHISDKALKNIHMNAKRRIHEMQKPPNRRVAYEVVQNYNTFVMGVHTYYALATHVSQDFGKIAFHIGKSLKARLKECLSKEKGTCSSLIQERYGKSKQLIYAYGFALIPIGYIKRRTPLSKKRGINRYTPEGRIEIHKKLEIINPHLLYYIMQNPVKGCSVEYNDNRLSLYCAQQGKCAIKGKILEIGKMHCHHKTPVHLGGKDNYGNLIFVTAEVHRLIHATDTLIIEHYMSLLKLTKSQMIKLNKLRKQAELQTVD